MEQVEDLAIRIRRFAINLIILLGGVFAFLLLQAGASAAQELPPPQEGSHVSSTSKATGTVAAASEGLSDQVEGAVTSTTSESTASTTDAAKPANEAPNSTGGTAKTSAETTTEEVTQATSATTGTARATVDATVEALSKRAAEGASELAAATGTASDVAHGGQQALAEAQGAILTASQPVLDASDEGQTPIATVATVQEATEPLTDSVEALVAGTSADLTELPDAPEVVASTAGFEFSGTTETTHQSATPSPKPSPSTVTGEISGGVLAPPPGPPTPQAILHGGSGPPADLGGGVPAPAARLASHSVPAAATLSPVTQWIPSGGGASVQSSDTTGPFDAALPHLPSPGSLVDGGKVLQLLTFAAFLTLLSLAASGMGRWLRLVPALARLQAFISLRERPG